MGLAVSVPQPMSRQVITAAQSQGKREIVVRKTLAAYPAFYPGESSPGLFCCFDSARATHGTARAVEPLTAMFLSRRWDEATAKVAGGIFSLVLLTILLAP